MIITRAPVLVKPTVAPPSTVTLSLTNKNANVTISGGGLTATGNVGAPEDVAGIATAAILSGQKKYFEATLIAAGGGEIGLGFANSSFTYGDGNWLGIDGNSLATYGSGNTYTGGTQVAHLASCLVGQTMGIAIDRTANNSYWILNVSTNTWTPGTYDPATNTGGLDISAILGDLFPAYNVGYQGTTQNSYTFNFGASAFVLAPPSGFSAL